MIEDGRLCFQIVVDILVDAPALQQTCEELGKPLLEVVKELTENFLGGTPMPSGIPGTFSEPLEALQFRLVRGPGLGAP